MSLLLNKTPPADIRNHVLPMIARALEANQQQIQVRYSVYQLKLVLGSFLQELLPSLLSLRSRKKLVEFTSVAASVLKTLVFCMLPF